MRVTKVRNTIDLSAFTKGLSTGGAEGLRLAVEHLLTEANKHVPHDDGTLERSGTASVESQAGKRRGAVSYDTPYAVRQHEDLELRHDGKGQAKWLETTMGRERGTVGEIVAAAIRRRTGG